MATIYVEIMVVVAFTSRLNEVRSFYWIAMTLSVNYHLNAFSFRSAFHLFRTHAYILISEWKIVTIYLRRRTNFCLPDYITLHILLITWRRCWARTTHNENKRIVYENRFLFFSCPSFLLDCYSKRLQLSYLRFICHFNVALLCRKLFVANM